MFTEKRLYIAGMFFTSLFVGAIATMFSVWALAAPSLFFLAAQFVVWTKPLIERASMATELTFWRRLILCFLKWFANAFVAVAVLILSTFTGRLYIGAAFLTSLPLGAILARATTLPVLAPEAAMALCFAAGFLVWAIPVIERASNAMEVALWRRLIFSIPKWFANACVAVAVLILSRSLVARAMELPPTDFELSVAACAILFFPLAWAFLIQVVMGVAGLLLLVMHFFVFLALWIQQMMGWHRPESSLQKLGVLSYLRACGALALLFLLFPLVNSYEHWINSLTEPVRWFAYFAEYHEIGKYPKLEFNSRARVHENGIVSYAEIVDGQVRIRVVEIK